MPNQEVVSSPEAISTERDASLLQRAVAAAASCVARLGLEKTTMDDIARESEISRATLYRRFGSREGILAATLEHYSRPFEIQVSAILTGPEPLPERIEKMLVWAVMNAPSNAHLKPFLQGMTLTGVDLFHGVFRERSSRLLHPVLIAARSRKELSESLEIEELIDWLLREMTLLISAGEWEEAKLKNRIRLYLLPVLCPSSQTQEIKPRSNASDGTVEERLARIEERLLEVHQMLGMFRQ